MDRQETTRLLNMALFLLKQPQEPIQAIGRDLYDFAIKHNCDVNIAVEATHARRLGFNRLECILYVRHKLNLSL